MSTDSWGFLLLTAIAVVAIFLWDGERRRREKAETRVRDLEHRLGQWDRHG